MPAFRWRRTALPMRAIERAVALEHPVNRRARGKLLKRTVLLQRQADRIGPVLAQDTVLTQHTTHAQDARFDLHVYVVPGATGLAVIKAHPVKTLAPCVLYPIGHRAHTHPKGDRDGAHASPRANRSNHLVTTFRNRTFLAMAHLSKMPLRYVKRLARRPCRPHARCVRSLPIGPLSTAAKFGTCRMIHPRPVDLWTSPADRSEPLGPCGQPMDNIRVAHRLPTLSGLSPTSSTGSTTTLQKE